MEVFSHNNFLCNMKICGDTYTMIALNKIFFLYFNILPSGIYNILFLTNIKIT
jgi:hypothetical protein